MAEVRLEHMLTGPEEEEEKLVLSLMLSLYFTFTIKYYVCCNCKKIRLSVLD